MCQFPETFKPAGTTAAVGTAHRIRIGQLNGQLGHAGATESYDLVIVGCAMAGLGAALEYSGKAKSGQPCLMLDNHPIFGGEAKENEFNVNGTTLLAPQGANGFFIPEQPGDWTSARGDARYYAQLGIPRELRYAPVPDIESPIRFCNDDFGYMVRGLQDRISIGHYSSNPSPGGNPCAAVWNCSRHRMQTTSAKSSRRC